MRCASFIARLYVDVLQASSSRRHKKWQKGMDYINAQASTILDQIETSATDTRSRPIKKKRITYYQTIFWCVSTQQIIDLTSCSLFIYLRKEKTKGFKLSNEQNSRVGKHLSVRSSSIIKIQTNPCHSCTYYLLPWPPVINYRFKAATSQQLTL